MGTRLDPFTRYRIKVAHTAAVVVPGKPEASFKAAAAVASLQQFHVLPSPDATGCPDNPFNYVMIGEGTYIPPARIDKVLRPQGMWLDDPSPDLVTCSVETLATGVPPPFKLPPELVPPDDPDPDDPDEPDPDEPKGPAPNVSDRPPSLSSYWAAGIIAGILQAKRTDPEVIIATAVSRGESVWGWPTQKVWHGHHNWGAIHCSSKPPGCECGFLFRDGPKGHIKPQCFRSWPTNEAGAAGFLKVLYGGRRRTVLSAAKRGDVYAVARAMRDTIYFCEIPGPKGGCSKREADKRKDAISYGKRLWRNVQAVQKGVKAAPCFWRPGGSDPLLVHPETRALLWGAVGATVTGIAVAAYAGWRMAK